MKRLLTIIIGIFCLLSCVDQLNEQPGTVIAMVDGESLTIEELTESYGINNWNEMTKDEQSAIINQWVNLTLLANHAKKNETINKDRTLKFIAKNAEKKIYANAIISDFLSNLKISEDELFNYYRLRQAEFTETAREFEVQRIYFKNEDDMKRVKQMLDNYEIRFTPAAQTYSEEGIGRNGGYMSSYVTKSGPDSLLWKALNDKERFFEATLRYNDGWLIARHINSREGISNKSFYDVKDQIANVLKEERRTDIYEQILKEARFMSNIVIEY